MTEEINKVALTSNDDDKRMQSIVLIETYTDGKSKDLVNEKEDIKYNKTMQKKLTLMTLEKKT